MTGSAFGFFNGLACADVHPHMSINGWAMDLAAFKANLFGQSHKQGAEIEDSIECYRQRLKMLRQKAPATVCEEPVSKVNAVEGKMIGQNVPTAVLSHPSFEVADAHYLGAFQANLLGSSFNQGARDDDSIECYRQRLKMIRQKTRTAVHQEPAHQMIAVEVPDAQEIHEETAAKCSAQLLEAKLQSKMPTFSSSVSTSDGTGEPQSDPEEMYPSFQDPEPDDVSKSSDGHDDQIEAFMNLFNGPMQWPPPPAALHHCSQSA